MKFLLTKKNDLFGNKARWKRCHHLGGLCLSIMNKLWPDFAEQLKVGWQQAADLQKVER